jgi:hypothetical protein
MAALLMELDPQLKESPRGIERNQLEIPPEIEAKMKVDERLTPPGPEHNVSGSGPNAQLSHPTGQEPKAPRSSSESEPRSAGQTTGSSSQAWPPSSPSSELEINAPFDHDEA